MTIEKDTGTPGVGEYRMQSEFGVYSASDALNSVDVAAGYGSLFLSRNSQMRKMNTMSKFFSSS